MKRAFFRPADILLPNNVYLPTWAVIACDQYSSERGYWTRADIRVGSEPSTLRMIVPEAYISAPKLSLRERAVGLAAEAYLKGDIFREYPNCFVYVERTLRDGRVRRGLVGVLDLEAYDYTGKNSHIRATEQTVADRLPLRARVRRGSPLEMTHIMALINDPKKTVIEPLANTVLPRMYSFDLMENSGHLNGYLVGGAPARELSQAVSVLPGGIVIGDGNHSLAAAKLMWEEIKQNLPKREHATCPARFALAEVCNIHDDAIDFHPIHRAVFNVDADSFIDGLTEAVSGDGQRTIKCVSPKFNHDTRARSHKEREIRVRDVPAGELIAQVQGYIDKYINERSGKVRALTPRVDYIHGEKSLRSVVSAQDSVGVIMPAIDKKELFRVISSPGGVFPRKSFSIGEAWDKRFYVECRKVK
ncbi:MAG: DUF1015 domain-containing protein [Oscillospiraceae bacterium]|jgi:uncharacterized protein (DUF1015 family)|nr:DUF1015 domain-containing protein [Oscillospiraceae bacterium]